MQWFKDMKISKKLLSAFIFIALLAGVVGAFGYVALDRIAALDKEMYEDNTVPTATLGNVLSYYNYYEGALKDFLLLDDAKVHDENKAMLETLKTSIDQYLASVEQAMVKPEEREQFELIRQTHAAFIPVSDEVVRLAMGGRKEEAKKLLYEKALPSSDIVVGTVYALNTGKAEQAKQTYEANAATARSSKLTMMIVLIVCVAVAVFLGLTISRMISRPIRTLVEASRKVADGDLNVAIDIRSKDELGTLAQSFSAMTDSMNEVLHNIANASEQVASGSRQVSEASQELSQGSTEQASSIQQLTASMEQIASQTKMNAKSAEQANELARSASADAEQGNRQMKEMLAAMVQINESSGNISKIIKVIDEIAFQTNILALNAAVEAARAGQHGKGFAVVAEEVRNLAARSANAAKETTALIEGSIKNVEAGTRIANDTAQALEKIVGGVGKAAQIVGSIASASHEQAEGIAQANQGIAQVSGVVQANSATSEECAAASEELSGQSEQLKETVGKFRLKRGASFAGSRDEHAAEFASRRARFSPAYAEVAASAASLARKPKIRLSDDDFGKYE